MNLSVILMLAIAVKAVIGYLTDPIKKLLSTPKAERDGVFILSLITPYVSFAAGFFVAYVANVDAFATFLPAAPYWLSLGLTSALVGGGASMLFDIVKSFKEWSGKIGAQLPVKPVPTVIAQPPPPPVLDAAAAYDAERHG